MNTILPEDINVNLDSKTLEQCLKGVSDFGGTTYQNICTGETNYVDWGSADWFLVVFLIVFFGTMLLCFIGVLFKIIFDY